MKAIAVCLFVSFFTLHLCSAGQEVVLMFKNGDSLKGEVVDCSPDAVKFRYQAQGEEKVATVDAKELDPYSFYYVRSLTVGDDAAAHLELAVFCLENGLYVRAITNYRKAKALDPAVVAKFDNEKKDLLIEKQAEKLLLSALKAVERNDLDSAASDISIILSYFPETRAAEQAKEVVTRVGDAKVREETEKMKKLESAGDETAEAGMVRVLLKDGTSLTGTVLETAEDSVTLQRRSGPGKVTNKLKAGRLDPVSFYRIRVRDIGDDAAAHLKLAGFCVRSGLFTRAYFEYEYAKAVDPTLVAQFEQDLLPEVEGKIAVQLLSSAKECIREGDYDRAEQDLAFLLTRFGDTSHGEEASQLLDVLAEKLTQRDAERAAGATAKLEAKDQKEEQARWKLMEPVQKTMEQGRKLSHDALKQSRSSQEIKKFESAASKYQQAIKQLEGLRKKHGEDPGTMAIIEKLESEARDEAVEAYLSAGNSCVDRSSFDQAITLSDKALKVDPDSQEVHAFRSRVEEYRVITSSRNLRGGQRGG